MALKYLNISALALCAASPAAAHPHVFVAVQVEVRLDDDGLLQGVHINWSYDDLFSLLVTEELKLDPDGDMILTAAETDALTAYIIDWPADYEGDLYLLQDDVPLPLAPVTEHGVTFENGVVTETLYRALITPRDTIAAPVAVQVYDPYYYVAYAVDPDIRITGRDGCTATLIPADVDSANAMVQDMLNGRAASDVGVDEQFPEVGKAFADVVWVACGG